MLKCSAPKTGAEADEARLAIWAFDTATLYAEFAGSSQNDPRPLGIALPPRADNPNLHAQSGLFTFPRWSAKVNAQTGVERKPLEDMVRGVRYPSGTLLRKITLATKHAREVLRLLHSLTITAANVYPGPDGVVRSLMDEQLITIIDDGTPRK